MRKSFKTFVFVWLIFLASFNIFVFAIPTSFNGKTIIEVVTVVGFITAAANGSFATLTIEKVKKCIEYSIYNKEKVNKYLDFAKEILNRTDFDIILGKYGTSFWIGYTVITICYFVLLICGIIAFKEKNSQRFFYRFPLIKISYFNLVWITAICLLCMYIPKFPAWLCVILCVLSALSGIVSLLWSNLASNVAIDKDEELSEYMRLFNDLTQDAKQLADTSKDANIKKVYEAIRYSDPISNEQLYDIEKNIYDSFVLLKDKHSNGKSIEVEASKLLALIKERNEKCKALK